VKKRVIGVIPSRWASSRFMGKPLAKILGKPLLQWVIEGARTSKKLDKIIVATDDARIERLALDCGVEVAMTSPELPSGTDRVWAAVQNEDADIVLNIQGDEPLIEGFVLDKLIDALSASTPGEVAPQMATLGIALKAEEIENLNAAKLLLDRFSNAIYFSRFAIPYSREKIFEQRDPKYILRHIGIYGYQKSFLKQFCETGVVLAEIGEALEQLRALYLGAKIRVVPIEHLCWGVDTPQDVITVDGLLRERGHR
jgi:3-deoxy-manno-octulosonate cytidylyltransferase (CMP-KDO synthetase)